MNGNFDTLKRPLFVIVRNNEVTVKHLGSSAWAMEILAVFIYWMGLRRLSWFVLQVLERSDSRGFNLDWWSMLIPDIISVILMSNFFLNFSNQSQSPNYMHRRTGEPYVL